MACENLKQQRYDISTYSVRIAIASFTDDTVKALRLKSCVCVREMQISFLSPLKQTASVPVKITEKSRRFQPRDETKTSRLCQEQ